MARKPTKKGLTKANDKLLLNILRLSRKHCERCGKTDGLQTAHVYSRRYRTTRWLEDNVLMLCPGCHFWNHDRPLEYADWFNEKWTGRKQRLDKTLRKPAKVTLGWLKNVHDSLRTRLTSLEPGK